MQEPQGYPEIVASGALVMTYTVQPLVCPMMRERTWSEPIPLIRIAEADVGQ